ncbi:hypothetical protein OHB29_02800 [Streptomyces violaceus]|uniref:Uncharacterized protein n=1 Tax=Streptomyces violaceus TaxID=1936 RepID=A0ABZ1P594_STRVL
MKNVCVRGQACRGTARLARGERAAQGGARPGPCGLVRTDRDRVGRVPTARRCLLTGGPVASRGRGT